MNFTQVGKRKYESATVREADDRDKGLRFSRSISGAAAAWVAINGNLTSLSEIADAITFLQSITADHFAAPAPVLSAAPPVDLMAGPPAASDAAETVPCHPGWRKGDVIPTDDGNRWIANGNGTASKA